MLDVRRDNSIEKKSPLLLEALRLSGIGVTVVPLFDGKLLATNELRTAGYANLGAVKGQIVPIETLRLWFGGHNPRRGLGIVTGRIVCLDFDSEASYLEYCAKWPIFSHSWTQKTKRGYHIYYRIENALDGQFKVNWPNTELKHNGALVACHYETIDCGLINPYTMLSVRDTTVLPIICSKVSEKKPFFSTEFKTATPHDNPIKRIKSELPINVYLERLGYSLQPYQNGTYSAKCPLHSDTKPSFWIAKGGQICNCHSCGGDLPMDIINLHTRLNSCSISQAISDLLRCL